MQNGTESTYLFLGSASVVNYGVSTYTVDGIYLHIDGLESPESLFEDILYVSVVADGIFEVNDKISGFSEKFIEADVDNYNHPLSVYSSMLTLFNSDIKLFSIESNISVTLRAPSNFKQGRQISISRYYMTFDQMLYRINISESIFGIISQTKKYIKIEKSEFLVQSNILADDSFKNIRYEFTGINKYAADSMYIGGIKFSGISWGKYAPNALFSFRNNGMTKRIQSVFFSSHDSPILGIYSDIGKIVILSEISSYFSPMISSTKEIEISGLIEKFIILSVSNEVEDFYEDIAIGKKSSYFSENGEKIVDDSFSSMFTYSMLRKNANSVIGITSSVQEVLIKAIIPKEIYGYMEEILSAVTASVYENVEISGFHFDFVSMRVFNFEPQDEEIFSYYENSIFCRIGDFTNISKVGLFREAFIDSDGLEYTKYSPRITYSKTDFIVETSYYMDILSLQRKNTVTRNISGYLDSFEIISQKNYKIGIDMSTEVKFSIPSEVIYEYYTLGSSNVIFDFRTKTNPILHMSRDSEISSYLSYHSNDEILDYINKNKIDLDSVFSALVTLNTSRYKRRRDIIKTLIDGDSIDEKLAIEAVNYMSSTKISEMHTLISEIPYNINILTDILVRMKNIVSSSLFTETSMSSFNYSNIVQDYSDSILYIVEDNKSELIEKIANRTVVSIKTVNMFENYFLTNPYKKSGLLSKSVYSNIISSNGGTKEVSIEKSFFNVRGMLNRLRIATKLTNRIKSRVSNIITYEVPPTISKIHESIIPICVGHIDDKVESYHCNVFSASFSDVEVVGVQSSLITYVTEKEIFGYSSIIMTSLSNNFHIGIEGMSCLMGKTEIIGSSRIFGNYENMVKVEIILANKQIYEWSSDFTYAKLLLAKIASRIYLNQKIMDFDISNTTFKQVMDMEHFYVDISSNNRNVSGKGSPDIKEAKLKEQEDDDLEPDLKNESNVCSITGTSIPDYMGFDHIITQNNGTNIGNLSYSEREILNSSVIKESRRETISKDRKLSEIDIFKRSSRDITLSKYVKIDPAPEWDIDSFALTEDELVKEGFSVTESSDIIGDFDKLKRDTINDIAVDLETSLKEGTDIFSTNVFPSFPDRILDDKFLSEKYEVVQNFIIIEEEL